jgi:hypothetical protein
MVAIALPAERIFLSYRAGLLSKPEPPSVPTTNFKVLLFHVILNNFSPAERLRLRSVLLPSSKGLMATRQSRGEKGATQETTLAQSRLHFDQARRNLEEMKTPRPAVLLATSTLEAAEAYLDYCLGYFDLARQHLSVALEADRILEERYGYSFLQAHRVQTVHNMFRIALKEGRREQALSLGGHIIAFLEGYGDSLPVHHTWAAHRMPSSLRADMLTQIANEMAPVLLGVSNTDWEIFKTCTGVAVRSDSNSSRIHNWLLLKNALMEADNRRYFDLLIEFLPKGRFGLECVWYSVVVDFIAFCSREDTRASRFVRNAILRDSAKWPNLPRAFQERLKGVAQTGIS